MEVLLGGEDETMLPQLTKGKWTRPTDKSAVYTEFNPGEAWGIRVTLIADYAKVEAIQGEKGTWYKGPRRFSTTVRPPTFFERLKGITFEDKIMEEVEKKRQVVREELALNQ